MHQFEFHRPTTVSGAAGLLSSHPEARLLAGGQTLLPTLKQRLANPGDLIDLSGVPDLSGIRIDGKAVTIGAMTRHADVAASPELARLVPALTHLAGRIGDAQVRNLGTLGGSIANADPAADYPAAILALSATVRTNRREIPGDSFFVDLFTTALEADEIVVGVSFTAPDQAAYVKMPQPASRFALVGVFVARTGADARVAVTGAAPSVFRVTEIETALSRSFTPQAIDGITVPAEGLNDDLHASAAYRAHLIPVLAKRAVAGII
jgi:carbon-monoxide dehydrogenase medium subunit